MKRTWIKVKCGILEPKHREKMGKTVWLYLYMLDLADWDKGLIKNWRDEYHAKEFGMEIRTFQEWRRILEEEGYITTIKHRNTQTIIIKNYTSPKEYSGEVYNLDGVTESGKSYAKLYSKDVTPTYNTHLKIKQTELSALRAHFSQVANIENPCWDDLDEAEKRAIGSSWNRPLILYWKLAGRDLERTKTTITMAVKGAGFDIYTPRSIQNIYSSYLRKPQNSIPDARDIKMPGE